jgi:hypothetical protein
MTIHDIEPIIVALVIFDSVKWLMRKIDRYAQECGFLASMKAERLLADAQPQENVK